MLFRSFFSGIALDVTPQISEDDQITLHIHPSVSLVTDKTKTLNLGSLGTFTLPLASSNVNESDTIVRVRDGTIAAIGGLMNVSFGNTAELILALFVLAAGKPDVALARAVVLQ